MKRIKLNDGSEQDVFSKAYRRMIVWARGETKYLKNKYRRRFRQKEKSLLKEEVNELE